MRPGPLRSALALAATALVSAACTTTDSPAVAEAPVTTAATPATPATSSSTTSTTTTTTTTTSTTTTTTTTIAAFPLTGTVTSPDGDPLDRAVVTIAGQSVVTAADGGFHIPNVEPGEVTVTRPAWLGQQIEWDGAPDIVVALQPRIVRGLRVSKYVFEDGGFERLGELLELSTANTLVFDTKDETGEVLYETTVEKAHELGAVEPMYDPVEALAKAREWGAYAITRVVSFEDKKWVRDPEAKLAGNWVDPTNPVNWEYPLALAVEACELGFDEIQFDYVRFPAGITAGVSQRIQPLTADDRDEAIRSYLEEARDRLHPLGCAVSADLFGIVMSSPTDEGIGQRPEEISTVVDAISPMVYPSHYSPGWLGFSDPNSHPGPVVADALDQGMARFEGTALMRPWLQAFYYNGSQILAGIAEAEARGVGWLLWNAAGNYAESWLPPQPE